MNILFIGDIFGECGIEAVEVEVPNIIRKFEIDYVIANAENASGGRGLTWNDYHRLKKAGINFFTMGNHTWHKKEIEEILIKQDDIIRPNNIVETEAISKIGVGTKMVEVEGKWIRITNLLGSTVNCKDIQTNPFLDLEKIVENDTSDIHIVDFHSETTSEKNALFINFQGRVSAIFGTHTHVQTNDNRIMNKTAYITDVGMTGPLDGIIGAKPESIISMFRGESERFKLEEQVGRYQFSAVVLAVDDRTSKILALNKILTMQQ